jgi:hypothetical protein
MAGSNLARFALGLAALAVPLGVGVASAGDVEQQLARLSIKCARDAEGRIVSVELPKRSTEIEIAPLLAIPTITEIRAPDCIATFDAFESLTKLPALSALYLDQLKDADQCVEHLSGLKGLKILSLANSTLTNSGLNEVCKAHPRLRELDVSSTQVTDYGLLLISARRELESLRMLNIAISRRRREEEHGTFNHVATLPLLRRLAVTGVEVKGQDLDQLAGNCQLEALVISPSDLRDPNAVTSLIALQDSNPSLRLGECIIRRLGIRRYNIRGQSLTELHNCPYDQFMLIPHKQTVDLERLRVIQPKDLRFLERLPKLRDLTLDGAPSSCKEFAHLTSARALTRLTIRRAAIDTETAQVLLALDSVRKVTLESCRVDGDALRTLKRNVGGLKVEIRD